MEWITFRTKHISAPLFLSPVIPIVETSAVPSVLQTVKPETPRVDGNKIDHPKESIISFQHHHVE